MPIVPAAFDFDLDESAVGESSGDEDGAVGLPRRGLEIEVDWIVEVGFDGGREIAKLHVDTSEGGIIVAVGVNADESAAAKGREGCAVGENSFAFGAAGRC